MTSFDWDGPQDVGDRLEIGFQVAEMYKFSEVALCLHNFFIKSISLAFRLTFPGTHQISSTQTLMGPTTPSVDHVSRNEVLYCSSYFAKDSKSVQFV